MKQFRKTYIEDSKSKDWMNRNLLPNQQSAFIRMAVKEKIIQTNKRAGKLIVY